MKFREQLKKANELGLNICDLVVANECACVFNFGYTEEQFEQLCSYAVYIYLKSEELTENAIAETINDLIKQGDYTVDEVLEMNKHEFIEVATYKA